MSRTAKPVVKNKFWIVEEDGKQIATIQSSPDGVTFVHNNKREKFVSIKLLKDKYNISIATPAKVKKGSDISQDVYGFPCDGTPYNILLNVAKKLPVYTKTLNSKSIFCAGHYLVLYNESYVHEYCPKLITLSRYEFVGPFFTRHSALEYARMSNEQ